FSRQRSAFGYFVVPHMACPRSTVTHGGQADHCHQRRRASVCQIGLRSSGTCPLVAEALDHAAPNVLFDLTAYHRRCDTRWVLDHPLRDASPTPEPIPLAG